VSAARKWSVPPGYRTLDDIVQEYGRAHAQTNLMSGQWPAFELDLGTGDLKSIPVTTWGVTRGRKWLEKAGEGESVWLKPAAWSQLRIEHYALVVQVSERQPPKRRKSPQGDRIKPAIAKCFPNGTDGISTKVVWKAVVDELKPDSKKRGLPDPSETSIKRTLGRRK
jgi:hypothetical protein